ncbi:MAG TPA: METTL5 family protein [Methanospirillum sp.]|uniref:METTL5 family protein n=1 Tax=Methanospirillum sp. TaxID=45200 RepID=UPI002D0A12C6|nr:METTL5 family protein [Methanospirillum sp.]HOJ97636.1 METTL5 family protein [Methanospirillum sp.]HPP78024.1 METTL5 family protein [Methanospirillum sp.]
MKLRQLEMLLERVSGFDNPSAEREQYQTPAPLAARLIHMAMLAGDITGHRVLDLGTGTGILAIGAALLGAEVVAIEDDVEAIRIAEANARDLGCSIRFIRTDITDNEAGELIPECDTVLMNPPFGAQTEHADRPFLDMALIKADVIYGIFNAGSGPFISEYIAGRGVITASVLAGLTIPRTFWFHTKDRHEIPVEIHVIKRI